MTDKNQMINISDMTQIPELNKNLKKSHLSINMNPNASGELKAFLSTQMYSDVYVKHNYKVNIDLVEEDFDTYLYFIECVEKASDKIDFFIKEYEKKYPEKYEKENISKLFGDINIWNFSICKGIMFELPFTLGNIIFIPLEYIEGTMYGNSNNLINTIIHEKIHISQRELVLTNIFVWDNYIQLNEPRWKKITNKNKVFDIINEEILNSTLLEYSEQYITNPDSFYSDFKYLLKLNENLYYGHYVYNTLSKRLEKRFFLVDIEHNRLVDIYDDEQIDTMCNIQDFEEHPYETFAYKIANDII